MRADRRALDPDRFTRRDALFFGTPAEAKQAVAAGFYLSFAGNVTFPKAIDMQQAAREAPEERMLVETLGRHPFLAPIPLRGKQNEPANTVHYGGLSGAAARNQRGADCSRDDGELPRLFPTTKI